METIDLNAGFGLHAHHIVDWQPPVACEPQPHLLTELKRSRRSRHGVNQSEHSRARQSFITGMGNHRVSAAELAARRAYDDDWAYWSHDND